MLLSKLQELNSILRVYNANFLNLHWNSCGEEFNDAHKSISTDYYELCDKYIDSTAEMITRLGGNPLNYAEVFDLLKESEIKHPIVDSSKLYKRIDIINWSDVMLGNICNSIVSILDDEELSNNVNAGIRSDIEAMHGEFDLQYRYINKRRML